MALSNELISQFAKLTNNTKKEDEGAEVKGTFVTIGGVEYVRMDGSEILTPVSTAVEAVADERVVVLIKDHMATVIKNITSPAARNKSVEDLKDEVDEHGNTIQQMDNTIIQQGNSIIQMNNSIYQQGVTINQHDTQINQQGDMIVSLDNTIVQQGNTISSMNNTIIQQGDSINSMNNTIVEHGNNITSIGNIVSEQGNTITSLGNSVTQIGNQVTEINNIVDEQNNTIIAFGNQIVEIDNAVQSHDNIIRQQGDQITSIGNTVNVQGSDITILNSGFKIVNGKLTGLSSAIIEALKTDELDAVYADIDFANIEIAAVEKLFTESGIIKDLVVQEGHITGELVGVTIKGDLIEAGTLIADKLVIKGENGLYYKLNHTGETIESQQTDVNSLSGSVITAKSITASKVTVDDLVAFGATIAGFIINDHAIHSETKGSINSNAKGIYMDKDGQFYLGDLKDHVKYYKDLNVPKEYQEVEYLESTGTQYINTGFIPSSKSKIELGVSLTKSNSGGVNALYGSRENNSLQFWTYRDKASGFQSRYGNGSVGYYSNDALYNNKFLLVQDKNKSYINNELKQINTTIEFQATQPLFLFNVNNLGSPQNNYGSFMKIYSCRLSDNNIIIKNLIPCYRISDNVPGMYDTYNDVFYVNSGTGNFIIGPDVEPNYVLDIRASQIYLGTSSSSVTDSLESINTGLNQQETATANLNQKIEETNVTMELNNNTLTTKIETNNEMIIQNQQEIENSNELSDQRYVETKNEISETQQTVQQISNIFKITGGTNLIKNSVWFYSTEGIPNDWIINGSPVYSGGQDDNLVGETISRGRIEIRGGSVQTSNGNIINLLVNRQVSFGFKYKNGLNVTSKVSIFAGTNTANTPIWTETYNTNTNGGWVTVAGSFVTTTPNYIIKIESTTSTGTANFIISDLMLNYGDDKGWELSAGEVFGGVIKLSNQGIQVTADTANTETYMMSNGVNVFNKTSGEKITALTDTGVETKNMYARESIKQKKMMHTNMLLSNGIDVYVEYIED